MENAFYLDNAFKLFSFLRYLHFCHAFFVMWKNSLIRKLRLVSKFMGSLTGQEITEISISSNIPVDKDNQAIKFG